MFSFSGPVSYADQRLTGLQRDVAHGHGSCCVNISTTATLAAQRLNVFSLLEVSGLVFKAFHDLVGLG